MDIKTLKYFDAYEKNIGFQIPQLIQDYNFLDGALAIQQENKFSAVYSSNLAGNSITSDDFMRYEVNKDNAVPAVHMLMIEDLYNAYEAARGKDITEKNTKEIHKIVARNMLPERYLGVYRHEHKEVSAGDGRFYKALAPEFIEKAMKAYHEDIESLLNLEMPVSKVFYYAALIHLGFLHLQPFMEGNHVIARLIEKGFLTQKLGNRFWQIRSEKYYKEHEKDYVFYGYISEYADDLDYDKCLGFIMMLPKCLQ